MAYGLEVYNSDGVKIISTGETSYYVEKEGTLSPDASGTTVTDFSKVSSLSYAYYLDDSFLHDYSERTNVTTWSSSTTYSAGDHVVLSGSVTSGTRVYECLQANTNNSPSTGGTYDFGDQVYWRAKYIRNGYDRTNDALYSEIEGQNALIFFKLPNTSDVICRAQPITVRVNNGVYGGTISKTAIDLEVPLLTNRSSLNYALVRPLTDFTPTVTGYGMQLYNASGDTIHITSEKLAHIDNFANRIGINSTIVSSSSAINWVGLPFYSNTVVQGDYGSGGTTRYTNYIKRDTSTNWKNEVSTYNAGTTTYGNTNQIKTSFLVGRFD
jgi:hypothetical protein